MSKQRTRAAAPATDPLFTGRVLHFVRHAQYESGERGSGKLTRLGRKQSALLARFFSGLPVASVAASDAPRAVESATILAETLGVPQRGRHALLKEVLPAPVPGMTIPRSKQREGAARVERIISRFFKVARASEHLVLVCHGNLIRSLVKRVVAGKVAGFHELVIHHAGVTSFLVTRRGVSLLGHNVVEHLPRALRTHA